jgi:hypothetical protein
MITTPFARTAIAAMATLSLVWPGAAVQGAPIQFRGPLTRPATANLRGQTLPKQLLFIPTEAGTIDIYPLKNPSGPIQSISGLTASQDQMVTDGAGNLYVVNNGASANDLYVSVLHRRTRGRRQSSTRSGTARYSSRKASRSTAPARCTCRAAEPTVQRRRQCTSIPSDRRRPRSRSRRRLSIVWPASRRMHMATCMHWNGARRPLEWTCSKSKPVRPRPNRCIFTGSSPATAATA